MGNSILLILLERPGGEFENGKKKCSQNKGFDVTNLIRPLGSTSFNLKEKKFNP